MSTHSWGRGPDACGARRPCRVACKLRAGVGAAPVTQMSHVLHVILIWD